jgi:hypothetical protein
MAYAFYHAATELFDKPNADRISDSSGMGINEYGWGFYLSISQSGAGEYLPERNLGYSDGRIGPVGFIHLWELDEKAFQQNAIVAHDPAVPFMGRILKAAEEMSREGDAAHRAKYAAAHEALLKEAPHFKTGSDLKGIACGHGTNLSPKEGAGLMSRAGIIGYLEGDYFVVYDPSRVSFDPLKVEGYGKQAIDHLRLLKEKAETNPASSLPKGAYRSNHGNLKNLETGRAQPQQEEAPPVEAELKKWQIDFRDSGKIASSELARAAWDIEKTRPALWDDFKEILREVHLEPLGGGPYGFDLRDKLGIALQQAVKGECDENRTNPQNLMRRLEELGVKKSNDPKASGLYEKIEAFLGDPRLNPASSKLRAAQLPKTGLRM